MTTTPTTTEPLSDWTGQTVEIQEERSTLNGQRGIVTGCHRAEDGKPWATVKLDRPCNDRREVAFPYTSLAWIYYGDLPFGVSPADVEGYR